MIEDPKKVYTPMNFGLRLLKSPTHSNLILVASQGEAVKASSVILSFNSPVIDHMTTELHLTSLDMKEFSKQAVQGFVEAVYTGDAAGLNRDTFRDINKMAHVFKVTWLVTKCEEQFSQITDMILEPSYHDLLFLFEEAVYVCKAKLNSTKVKDFALEKIRSLTWEQQFISKYLEINGTFSTNQLDILIELAGTQITCIVQPIADNLTAQLEASTKLFPDQTKYLLDNCDLSRYRLHSVEMFERLFDLLREVLSESPELYKWIFDLYRASTQKALEPNLEAALPDDAGPGDSIANVSEDKPLVKEISLKKLHNLDCSMGFEDFINWMGQSPDIRNLMMFVEGLMAWMDAHTILIPEQCSPEVLQKIVDIKQKRNWKTIPLGFFEFMSIFIRSRSTAFVSLMNSLMDCKEIVTKNNHQWHEEYALFDDVEPFALTKMSRPNIRKYFVEYSSHGTKCPIPGDCGIILQSSWHKETGLDITLCTDPEENTEDFHCHCEVKAGNIHVQPAAVFLSPLAWHDVPGPGIMDFGAASVISMNVFIAK